eukprot:gene6435-1148_t
MQAILAVVLVAGPAASVAWDPWGYSHPPATAFDPDVSASFLPSSKRTFVLRVAKKRHLPLAVILTMSGCQASQSLKRAVNYGREFRDLVRDGVILVAHAEDTKTEEWTQDGQSYSPQVFFYAPGDPEALPIPGTNENSPRYFTDEAALVWGVRKALEVVDFRRRSTFTTHSPTGVGYDWIFKGHP